MKNLGQKSIFVLSVLADEMMYWKKAAVFPSHERILKELAEKLSVHKGARTLMRWLAIMESSALISRNKRHRFTPQNGWEFRSSLYQITMLGWSQLRRARFYTWDQIKQFFGEVSRGFRKKKTPQRTIRPRGELTSVGDIMVGLGYNTS